MLPWWAVMIFALGMLLIRATRVYMQYLNDKKRDSSQ